MSLNIRTKNVTVPKKIRKTANMIHDEHHHHFSETQWILDIYTHILILYNNSLSNPLCLTKMVMMFSMCIVLAIFNMYVCVCTQIYSHLCFRNQANEIANSKVTAREGNITLRLKQFL